MGVPALTTYLTDSSLRGVTDLCPQLRSGRTEVIISKFSVSVLSCFGLRLGWKGNLKKTMILVLILFDTLIVQNMCPLSFISITYKPFQITFAAALRERTVQPTP